MKYLILLCCALPLYATVIVQKNGDVISGTIAEEKNDRYVFQSPYGKLQIKKNNISKLILDEKTIELTTIKHNDQTVQARLVSDENNKQIYLTEDGQTIRKESETAAVTPALKADFLLFSLAGDYGYSTFQHMGSSQSSGGQPPFDQTLHAKTFGFRFTGHYVLSKYFGLGLLGSMHRWSDTLGVTPPPPAPQFDATSTHISWHAGPSLVASVLGNLGDQQRSHDLRFEISGGAALNAAEMVLTFKAPLNGFPSEARASGKNIAPSLQAQFYYLYSVSESFRLKLGAGYSRIFYSSVFDKTLRGAETMPGAPAGFKGDFEKNLAATADNPQIISVVVGVEYGF